MPRSSTYGKGKYCRKPDDCLDITAIERIMSSSRDPQEWEIFSR